MQLQPSSHAEVDITFILLPSAAAAEGLSQKTDATPPIDQPVVSTESAAQTPATGPGVPVADSTAPPASTVVLRLDDRMSYDQVGQALALRLKSDRWAHLQFTNHSRSLNNCYYPLSCLYVCLCLCHSVCLTIF